MKYYCVNGENHKKPGRTPSWASAFYLLQKFLSFSKNMELLANRDPLWPILLEKACYDKRNEELVQDYFHIDPRNRILLLEKYTHICHFFPAIASQFISFVDQIRNEG